MTISLHDRNIIVAYLQIFLKENFPDARVYNEDGTSEVLNTKTLKVTGSYDYLTYMILSCYMYATYPREGYPRETVWTTVIDEKTGEEKVVFSMKDFDISNHSEEIEKGENPLKNVILENINETCEKGYYQIVDIPERVLSYIFNEVVTSLSTKDEVFRVQKLIYAPDKVPFNLAGDYEGVFEDTIKDTQQRFIDIHTYKDVGIKLPSNYEGFKVTGYCDPWTEVLYERTD